MKEATLHLYQATSPISMTKEWCADLVANQGNSVYGTNYYTNQPDAQAEAMEAAAALGWVVTDTQDGPPV